MVGEHSLALLSFNDTIGEGLGLYNMKLVGANLCRTSGGHENGATLTVVGERSLTLLSLVHLVYSWGYRM